MKLTQFPNRNTEPEDSLDLLCSQCFQNSMSLSSLFSLESPSLHTRSCMCSCMHSQTCTHTFILYRHAHTHMHRSPHLQKLYVCAHVDTHTHTQTHNLIILIIYLSKALFLKVDFNYRARNSQVLELSLWASAPAQVQVWLHCSQCSSSHCLLNSRSPTKSYTQSMESFLPSIKDTLAVLPSSCLHILNAAPSLSASWTPFPCSNRL